MGRTASRTRPGRRRPWPNSIRVATTAQTTSHTIFQQAGGDLNIFYTSSSWAPTYIWSLTDKIFDLTRPLFQACTAIDTATAPAITYGNAISGSAPTTLAFGSQLVDDSTYNSGLPNNGALGWVPLVATPGDYQITAMINGSGAGKFVEVMLDGDMIGGGPISVPVSNSAVAVNLGTHNLTAGQHGLMINGQFASSNSYSGNSCSFTSFVLTPVPALTITGQPQDQSVSLGGAASFSVSVTGANPAYQWYFNGAALNGQTGATLSLTNVVGQQAGAYSVTVTNTTGMVTSTAATLTVTATYSQWAMQNFSTTQQTNDPASILPDATPDNDGVPNLLKFLLNIDPSQPMAPADVQALPRGGTCTDGNGNRFVTLTYRENPLAAGSVVVTPQMSPDLQSWQTAPAAAAVGIDPVTGDALMQVVAPVAPGGREFLRLQVSGG